MAESMKPQYKGGKITCRSFSDNSQICMSKKAWNIFFATINKMKADDTKPRPQEINETVFQETVKIVMDEFVEWAVRRG